MQLLAKIDRFGIEAILGRKTFYFGELKAMIVAENVFNAYQSRKSKFSEVAKWAEENPAAAALLFEVEKMLQDTE